MQDSENLQNWLQKYIIPTELAGTVQKCQICEQEFTVRKSGLPPKYGICKKCKCSFTSKNRVVTEEQKQQQKEKALNTWQSKSEEERKAIVAKRKSSLSETCKSRTAEERSIIAQNIRNAQAALSFEKKLDISTRKRETQKEIWSKRSADRIKELREKNSKGHCTTEYLARRRTVNETRTESQWRDIRSKSQHKYFYGTNCFDSSWELAIWIWAKDKGMSIEQEPVMFEYEFNGNLHKYFPDFRLEDDLIEAKGDHFFREDKMICPFDESKNDLYEAKHQCGLKNQVKFWRAKEMQPVLEYINSKYTADYLKLFLKDLPFPYPCKLSNDFDLIRYFHKSIYKANRHGYKSPYDAWQDKDLIKKSALNRLKYVGRCTPSDVLQGFNVAKIAPKVSVFKPALATELIQKYLIDADIIVDPFSGFSGRMLGAFNSKKQYIGFDLNKDHVRESNEIINYKKIDDMCSVEVQDLISAPVKDWSYLKDVCLFTCPPYSNKESWAENEVTMPCDEWIDLCLEKHKGCKRYLFVVDETEKYKDCVVQDLKNKSHFGENTEKVVLIK